MASHFKSIAKAITWRVLGAADTFVLSLFVTGKATAAVGIVGFELLTKSVLYYGHERAWEISWFANSNSAMRWPDRQLNPLTDSRCSIKDPGRRLWSVRCSIQRIALFGSIQGRGSLLRQAAAAAGRCRAPPGQAAQDALATRKRTHSAGEHLQEWPGAEPRRDRLPSVALLLGPEVNCHQVCGVAQRNSRTLSNA